jgi:hypothetical protein
VARWIISVFGTLVACLGLWVVVSPRGLVQFADAFLTPGGIWFAAALRITLGLLLWGVAGASRTPGILRLLGVLFVASGVALPFIGLDRVTQVAQWGAAQEDLLLRSVGLLTAGIGAFLTWSVWPRRSAQ